MTIIQQDIHELSDAIKSVTGFGLEVLREDGRSSSEIMTTKVALCYYMYKKKYSITQISNALNRARSSVYHYFKCHENMMFSDQYYKRCIEAIDYKLNDTEK